jgi:copper resistance protein C
VSYAAFRLTGAARMILGALVGAGFLVTSAAPATAHTALAASSPEDGARLSVAPNQIALEFASPILNTGSRAVVLGPDGRHYEYGGPQVTQNKLMEPLSPLGSAGQYRIEFRVVAADGHPLGGGLKFTLTKPGPAAGGSNTVARAAPTAAVRSLTTANDAPSWEPWTAATAAVIFAAGAMWIGRRVTRGLD